MQINYIQEPKVSRFLFSDTRIACLWLLVRLYVGWQWLHAGWEKVTSSVWVGKNAGGALAGFLQGALSKTAGEHPDVSGWYAYFLQHVVLAHVGVWSNIVSYGELIVGITLILGILTGISAFFGLFMNLNYLLAGTVRINPILFTLSIGLVLAWKVAGFLGFDRFLLPFLGTPWQPGKLFTTRTDA
jgi:thiosulfate dehydrogenase [quinone] large subunit